MRTKKQQKASRQNGRKSRGPVTPEGKARSSQNAITHGIHARAVVLHNENSEKFAELDAAYRAYWNPRSVLESDLVNDIVTTRWRLNRLLASETAVLDREMDRQREAVRAQYQSIDECTRTALAYTALADGGHTLVTMGRSETRYRRALENATDRLFALRSQKDQNEPGNEQLKQNQNAGGDFSRQERQETEPRP